MTLTKDSVLDGPYLYFYVFQIFVYFLNPIIDLDSEPDRCIFFKSKVKLATVVEGNQKAPFSIATTMRCRRGCYSFPWIASLYSRYVPYNNI